MFENLQALPHRALFLLTALWLTLAFAYTYSAANQRVGQTTTDNSFWSYPTTVASTSYTPNNLDQYTAIGTATPTYDGNGNLTFDGTYTFGYDAESRLTTVSVGTTAVAAYAYNPLGHLKSQTLSGTTTILLNDADNNPLLDYAGQGTRCSGGMYGAARTLSSIR